MKGSWLNESNAESKDNVLVTRSGVARICDFGISRMIAASQPFGETNTNTGIRGSVRWMSPELLFDGQAEHSMESDVWAFGMTIYVSPLSISHTII